MIIRIVRMHFTEEGAPLFLALFEARKERIRNYSGCMHLELWQDTGNPLVWYTYSYWDCEPSLEGYRLSDFFRETWAQTKALFAEKAQAWSMSPKAVIG